MRILDVLELKGFAESRNRYVLDFCWNCADAYMSKKSTKKKMFAWIALQTLRNSPRCYHFTTIKGKLSFVLLNQFLEEWDLSIIQKYKYNPRYYTFLEPIVRDFIESGNYGIRGIPKFNIWRGEDGMVLQLKNKLEVEEDE